MKKIEISNEELEMMNYNDIAYIILQNNDKKMKIVDLFNLVCELLDLDKDECVSQIGDFFELLSTDKRFIMLDEGYWDLKIKHNKGMITFDDEEDDEENLDLEENEDEIEDESDSYSDEDKSDDDTTDDDLADLVIIDDSEDENNA